MARYLVLLCALAAGLLAQPVSEAGPRVGLLLEAGGGSLARDLLSGGATVESANLLDYTFGSAPTDWLPGGGTWQVSSRFACDPTWSFFGGWSRGLACIWNKRRLAGDQMAEAYVAFKHGLPFNAPEWGETPVDLAITLCGDGRNPASGYSFIFGADQGAHTVIRQGSRVLASTSDPRFLPPSLLDRGPDGDDLHRAWWRLEARRSGGRLIFSVDGQEALNVADETPITSGQTALWTLHNGMMVARARLAFERELAPDVVPLVVPIAAPLEPSG